MRVLLTSGGTKISIDMVRSITNMSSGTFGSAICEAFLRKGFDVDFLMAEGSKTPFELRLYGAGENNKERFLDWQDYVKQFKSQYNQHTYKTFQNYADYIKDLTESNKYDIIVLAAAVSDYGVANYVDGKIRSSSALEIKLTPLPKIISTIRAKQPQAYFVGFKLLVNSADEELVAAAKESLNNNGCDMVVANDLRDMQQDDHRLLIVTPEQVVTKTKNLNSKSLAWELVNTINENVLTPKKI